MAYLLEDRTRVDYFSRRKINLDIRELIIPLAYVIEIERSSMATTSMQD